MKTYKYTAEMANGKLETFTVPRFMDPKEIAEHLHNSLVYLHIDKNMACYGMGFFGKIEEIKGPATVMIIDKEYYLVPRCPVNEADSMAIWKEYKPRLLSDGRINVAQKGTR